ncbi:MAG: multiheme c-type cytochrome [Anaerolineales bacterium]
MIIVGGLLLIGLFVYYVGMPAFMAAMGSPAPRYVPGEGEYQGAEYCGSCHPQQLKGWRGALHSKTTTKALFEVRFEELSWAMSREQCDGCHAPTLVEEIREEGVTCEVCHGPGRTGQIVQDICMRCHQSQREAGTQTMLSTPAEFLQNLPTGAPENMLFLEVTGYDEGGAVAYHREVRFEKESWWFRTMPMMVRADTRLTDGETRAIEFLAPDAVRAEVTLLIRPILWTGEQVEQVIDAAPMTLSPGGPARRPHRRLPPSG